MEKYRNILDKNTTTADFTMATYMLRKGRSFAVYLRPDLLLITFWTNTCKV